MSEPRRFLTDPAATPFERDLLESWSGEQPSPAARARALAIAGAAAGVVVAGAAATAAASASATASTAAASAAAGAAGAAAPGAGAATAGAAGAGAVTAVVGAPKVATLGMAALAKWLVVGAVVAGGTAAVVAQVPSRTPEPAATNARATTSPPALTAPGTPATAPNANANANANAPAPSEATGSAPSADPPTISPADLPAASATPAATALIAPPARSAAPAHDETLAAEIALFDRVRAAVNAGESDRALGLLDDYERRFPAGAFRQEAEVVRVQALLQKGNRAAATRAGERFLAAHPTSPHAARLRAMLNPSTP